MCAASGAVVECLSFGCSCHHHLHQVAVEALELPSTLGTCGKLLRLFRSWRKLRLSRRRRMQRRPPGRLMVSWRKLLCGYLQRSKLVMIWGRSQGPGRWSSAYCVLLPGVCFTVHTVPPSLLGSIPCVAHERNHFCPKQPLRDQACRQYSRHHRSPSFRS